MGLKPLNAFGAASFGPPASEGAEPVHHPGRPSRPTSPDPDLPPRRIPIGVCGRCMHVARGVGRAWPDHCVHSEHVALADVRRAIPRGAPQLRSGSARCARGCAVAEALRAPQLRERRRRDSSMAGLKFNQADSGPKQGARCAELDDFPWATTLRSAMARCARKERMARRAPRVSPRCGGGGARAAVVPRRARWCSTRPPRWPAAGGGPCRALRSFVHRLQARLLPCGAIGLRVPVEREGIVRRRSALLHDDASDDMLKLGELLEGVVDDGGGPPIHFLLTVRDTFAQFFAIAFSRISLTCFLTNSFSPTSSIGRPGEGRRRGSASGAPGPAMAEMPEGADGDVLS